MLSACQLHSDCLWQPLFGNCLATAQRLHGDWTMTARWLNSDCTVTAQWLCSDCTVTARGLGHHKLSWIGLNKQISWVWIPMVWVPMELLPMAWVPMAWVPKAWVPMAWVLGLMGTVTARQLHGNCLCWSFPSLGVPRKHGTRRSCCCKRGFSKMKRNQIPWNLILQNFFAFNSIYGDPFVAVTQPPCVTFCFLRRFSHIHWFLIFVLKWVQKTKDF